MTSTGEAMDAAPKQIYPIGLVGLLTVVGLLFIGVLWPNALFVSNYPVRGLDVSRYQGQIDWHRVAQTHQYTCVFVKATEGKTNQDANFQANWRGTKAQGLLRGAYHYFTSNRTSIDQADNFISLVPKEVGMLLLSMRTQHN